MAFSVKSVAVHLFLFLKENVVKDMFLDEIIFFFQLNNIRLAIKQWSTA